MTNEHKRECDKVFDERAKSGLSQPTLLVSLPTCLGTPLRTILLWGPVRPPEKNWGAHFTASAPGAENPSYATDFIDVRRNSCYNYSYFV